jgi:hypothetical protein
VDITRLDELPRRLPFYDEARVSELQWRARIAARQAAFAERMLG